MDYGPKSMTIGRLASAVGVNVETIRFYQRKGLLRVPARAHGAIRHYAPQDAARVKFIKSAQRLGFSLEEIRHLLRLDAGMQCRTAAQLAARHLSEVRLRIDDLARIERTLIGLLERCNQGNDSVRCPLIDALHGKG
jgi:MerR family mercuric resistance operon transcriptional regulator